MVELSFHVKELACDCQWCGSPLQLSNYVEETMVGMGKFHCNFLYITRRELRKVAVK